MHFQSSGRRTVLGVWAVLALGAAGSPGPAFAGGAIPGGLPTPTPSQLPSAGSRSCEGGGTCGGLASLDGVGTPLAVPVGASDHILGESGVGGVTLVVYGDLQCPYCAQQVPVVSALGQKYRGKLRIVFRHFPLQAHLSSHLFAQATEAAAAQGKFQEMLRWIYANSHTARYETLLTAAGGLGLDVARFKAALDTHAYVAAVNAQRDGGLASKVKGTPTYFLNGKLAFIGAQEQQVLDDAIARLLASSPAPTGHVNAPANAHPGAPTRTP